LFDKKSPEHFFTFHNICLPAGCVALVLGNVKGQSLLPVESDIIHVGLAVCQGVGTGVSLRGSGPAASLPHPQTLFQAQTDHSRVLVARVHVIQQLRTAGVGNLSKTFT